MSRTDAVREISELRVSSLEDSFGGKVKVKELEHMMDGKFIDLRKAENWQEWAAAERIAKEPRRQSCDEKDQLIKLARVFPGIKKIKREQVFIVEGNVMRANAHTPPPNSYDLDAECLKDGHLIVYTCKGGQDVDGGHQNHQFDQMLGIIQHAPAGGSATEVTLVVYVSGHFWTKERHVYRNWEEECTPPFSLVDLLTMKARDRKCVVFSDANLPTDVISISRLQEFYV